jgi:hypothetical protein
MLFARNHKISFMCLEVTVSVQVPFPGPFYLFPKIALQGNYFISMQNFHQNDKKSTKRAKFLNVTM